MPGGRPEIPINEDVCKKAEALAAGGLTVEEIAGALGMSGTSLYEKQKKYPEFVDAIKAGRLKGRAVVSNKLMDQIRDGNLGAIIWYEKTRCGLSDRIDVNNTGNITHKHEGLPRSLEILGEIQSERGSQSTEDTLPN